MLQDEFANIAGVSVATVSRAMNGNRRVTPNTRKRIKRLARQVGYRPDAAARAMVKGQVQSVGLMICSPKSHEIEAFLRFYSPFIPELGAVLNDADLNLMLGTLSGMVSPDSLDMLLDMQLPKMLEESHTDSVVVLCHMWPALAETLRRWRIFAAVVDGPSCGQPAVQRDEIGAIGMAVSHLVELGHQRIAYLDWGPRSAEGSYRQLLWPKGYLKAMAEHQLIPAPGWEMYPDIKIAVNTILNLDNPPTAIIAYDDYCAIALIQLFGSMGLSVPGDISIVSMRDIGLRNAFIPTLTVMGTPFKEMARQVGRWMADPTIRPTRPEDMRVQLPAELLVGGSSAPPAKRG